MVLEGALVHCIRHWITQPPHFNRGASILIWLASPPYKARPATTSNGRLKWSLGRVKVAFRGNLNLALLVILAGIGIGENERERHKPEE
jgi:hypothetical protein